MKICKNCGAEIQDGAAFCTHCGTKVEEQKVEEQRVEPEKTEQAAQPVEPEQTSGQSQAEGQNAGAQNVNYGGRAESKLWSVTELWTTGWVSAELYTV
ncbi:MAG: zinc-ribbon domain-containing protein [Dorea sp.]